MRTALLVSLALLATLLVAAPASATHATCGPADGTFLGLVDLWVSSCFGAGLSDAWACTVINVLHVEALDQVSVAVMHECETGAWLT